MPRWSKLSVVLDASAAVELLRRTPEGERAKDALRGRQVVVPAHFDAEVFSALGRLARAGDLDEGAVAALLGVLAQAPFVRCPVQPFLARAWECRHNLALRDALYVTVARRLEAELVTADARLAQAPNLGIVVHLVLDR